MSIPLTLRETIKHSVHYYPTLSPSRAFVLNHLFCTNGNGFAWINGRLVEHRPRYDDPLLRDAWDTEGLPEGTAKTFARLNAKRRERVLTVHAVEDQIVDGEVSLRELPDFSQLCRFSALCCVPDDVQPDWLAGALEVAQLIVELIVELGERESTPERAVNAAKARDVIAELRGRFAHLD